MLNDIVRKCLTCGQFGSSSSLLRVDCAQQYVLNQVTMDIVYKVGRDPTLNNVCCVSKLMDTFDLGSRLSEEAWRELSMGWVLRFLDPPQLLVVGVAGEFVSYEFRTNCQSIEIELLEKYIEEHRSFDVCGLFNAVIRAALNKCWVDPHFANLGKTGLLAITTHFVNSTVKETKISAYLLVFGQQLTFVPSSAPQITSLVNG